MSGDKARLIRAKDVPALWKVLQDKGDLDFVDQVNWNQYPFVPAVNPKKENLVTLRNKRSEGIGKYILDLQNQKDQKGAFCDVFIRAKDGQMSCHSPPLCAFSDLLRRLIHENLKEIGVPTVDNRIHIHLPDFEVEHLHKVILLFYTGYSSFSPKWVASILSILTFLRVDVEKHKLRPEPVPPEKEGEKKRKDKQLFRIVYDGDEDDDDDDDDDEDGGGDSDGGLSSRGGNNNRTPPPPPPSSRRTRPPPHPPPSSDEQGQGRGGGVSTRSTRSPGGSTYGSSSSSSRQGASASTSTVSNAGPLPPPPPPPPVSGGPFRKVAPGSLLQRPKAPRIQRPAIPPSSPTASSPERPSSPAKDDDDDDEEMEVEPPPKDKQKGKLRAACVTSTTSETDRLTRLTRRNLAAQLNADDVNEEARTRSYEKDDDYQPEDEDEEEEDKMIEEEEEKAESSEAPTSSADSDSSSSSEEEEEDDENVSPTQRLLRSAYKKLTNKQQKIKNLRPRKTSRGQDDSNNDVKSVASSSARTTRSSAAASSSPRRRRGRGGGRGLGGRPVVATRSRAGDFGDGVSIAERTKKRHSGSASTVSGYSLRRRLSKDAEDNKSIKSNSKKVAKRVEINPPEDMDSDSNEVIILSCSSSPSTSTVSSPKKPVPTPIPLEDLTISNPPLNPMPIPVSPVVENSNGLSSAPEAQVEEAVVTSSSIGANDTEEIEDVVVNEGERLEDNDEQERDGDNGHCASPIHNDVESESDSSSSGEEDEVKCYFCKRVDFTNVEELTIHSRTRCGFHLVDHYLFEEGSRKCLICDFQVEHSSNYPKLIRHVQNCYILSPPKNKEPPVSSGVVAPIICNGEVSSSSSSSSHPAVEEGSATNAHASTSSDEPVNNDKEGSTTGGSRSPIPPLRNAKVLASVLSGKAIFSLINQIHRGRGEEVDIVLPPVLEGFTYVFNSERNSEIPGPPESEPEEPPVPVPIDDHAVVVVELESSEKENEDIHQQQETSSEGGGQGGIDVLDAESAPQGPLEPPTHVDVLDAESAPPQGPLEPPTHVDVLDAESAPLQGPTEAHSVDDHREAFNVLDLEMEESDKEDEEQQQQEYQGQGPSSSELRKRQLEPDQGPPPVISTKLSNAAKRICLRSPSKGPTSTSDAQRIYNAFLHCSCSTGHTKLRESLECLKKRHLKRCWICCVELPTNSVMKRHYQRAHFNETDQNQSDTVVCPLCSLQVPYSQVPKHMTEHIIHARGRKVVQKKKVVVVSPPKPKPQRVTARKRTGVRPQTQTNVDTSKTTKPKPTCRKRTGGLPRDAAFKSTAGGSARKHDPRPSFIEDVEEEEQRTVVVEENIVDETAALAAVAAVVVDMEIQYEEDNMRVGNDSDSGEDQYDTATELSISEDVPNNADLNENESGQSQNQNDTLPFNNSDYESQQRRQAEGAAVVVVVDEDNNGTQGHDSNTNDVSVVIGPVGISSTIHTDETLLIADGSVNPLNSSEGSVVDESSSGNSESQSQATSSSTTTSEDILPPPPPNDADAPNGQEPEEPIPSGSGTWSSSSAMEVEVEIGGSSSSSNASSSDAVKETPTANANRNQNQVVRRQEREYGHVESADLDIIGAAMAGADLTQNDAEMELGNPTEFSPDTRSSTPGSGVGGNDNTNTGLPTLDELLLEDAHSRSSTSTSPTQPQGQNASSGSAIPTITNMVRRGGGRVSAIPRYSSPVGGETLEIRSPSPVLQQIPIAIRTPSSSSTATSAGIRIDFSRPFTSSSSPNPHASSSPSASGGSPGALTLQQNNSIHSATFEPVSNSSSSSSTGEIIEPVVATTTAATYRPIVINLCTTPPPPLPPAATAGPGPATTAHLLSSSAVNNNSTPSTSNGFSFQTLPQQQHQHTSGILNSNVMLIPEGFLNPQQQQFTLVDSNNLNLGTWNVPAHPQFVEVQQINGPTYHPFDDGTPTFRPTPGVGVPIRPPTLRQMVHHNQDIPPPPCPQCKCSFRTQALLDDHFC